LFTVESDAHYMRRALELAAAAGQAGEIPIGAVLVDAAGRVIGEGANSREETHDPTDHAELTAMRAAARELGDWRLSQCTMYVTVEPCPMCAGACVMSRLGTLVIGAWNDEYGATGSRWDLVRDARLPHRVEVRSGVLAQECGDLLREFLAERRNS
jgi:tRNA(adenine34) deaminase